jgi:pimeloyl-ACP methyl ester carboxylesterase
VEPTVQSFTASDGVSLTWHEMGQGQPLILIHGYFSNAQTNWITYRTAAHLVAQGYRLIMPDLRAHGASDKPHEPEFYPPDILADDGLSLIRHLGLRDYDLGGYSLGARTAVRMLVKGASPRRAIVSGMGLEGIINTQSRSVHFRHILDNLGQNPKGSPEWMAEAFLKSMGGDAAALRLILDSFVDTSAAEIARIETPVAVICGAEDDDNGSAAALADALPHGALITIPGNHMSAVTKPEFGAAFVAFLSS